jgi:hypothetical protein
MFESIKGHGTNIVHLLAFGNFQPAIFPFHYQLRPFYLYMQMMMLMSVCREDSEFVKRFSWLNSLSRKFGLGFLWLPLVLWWLVSVSIELT